MTEYGAFSVGVYKIKIIRNLFRTDSLISILGSGFNVVNLTSLVHKLDFYGINNVVSTARLWKCFQIKNVFLVSMVTRFVSFSFMLFCPIVCRTTVWSVGYKQGAANAVVMVAFYNFFKQIRDLPPFRTKFLWTKLDERFLRVSRDNLTRIQVICSHPT